MTQTSTATKTPAHIAAALIVGKLDSHTTTYDAALQIVANLKGGKLRNVARQLDVVARSNYRAEQIRDGIMSKVARRIREHNEIVAAGAARGARLIAAGVTAEQIDMAAEARLNGTLTGNRELAASGNRIIAEQGTAADFDAINAAIAAKRA